MNLELLHPNIKKWFTVETSDEFWPVEQDVYPDGSFSFRCDLSAFDPRYRELIHIRMKTTLPQAFIALSQLKAAIHYQLPLSPIHLDLQTIPDQRADKFTKPGDFPAAFVSLAQIEMLGFDNVTVYDPHSNYWPEHFQLLGGKLTIVDSLECFQYVQHHEFHEVSGYVVQVDEGAKDRVELFAEEYDTPIIEFVKHRDANGKITSHEIADNTPEVFLYKDIWVIDDLCDGGATFINVAKKLKEFLSYGYTGELNLYVTHGLFSKGKEELLKYYDNIYCLFDYSEQGNNDQ